MVSETVLVIVQIKLTRHQYRVSVLFVFITGVG